MGGRARDPPDLSQSPVERDQVHAAGRRIWIKVGWTASGGQYFSVKDTGPGIPEDEIPIVLASFGQGSNAIKSAEQGAGLGLPIAKSLVDLHGGTFTLKSKLRVGTEVIIALPPERVMSALAPLQQPSPPTQPQAQGDLPIVPFDDGATSASARCSRSAPEPVAFGGFATILLANDTARPDTADDRNTLRQDLRPRSEIEAVPGLRPHVDEIAGWSRFTSAERETIMTLLPGRLATLDDNASTPHATV